MCFSSYGNPDCSYKRKNKNAAGGLQIGLSFIGVNDVGNFIICDLSHAILQLLMGFFTIFICCFSVCVFVCAESDHGNFTSCFWGLISCITVFLVLGASARSIINGVLILIGNKSDSDDYSLS